MAALGEPDAVLLTARLNYQDLTKDRAGAQPVIIGP